MKWDFVATKEKQDPYEEILPLPRNCTVEEFLSMGFEDRKKVMDEIIAEIRKINIFPIYYFNEDGIKKEIQSVINKKVGFTNDTISIYNYEGMTLLDFLFPNLHLIKVNRGNTKSVYERFYDDNMLRECLYDHCINKPITNMRSAFILNARYKWSTGINYVPLRAKAIYEKFCPENGIVYDFCAGFGARMLGALSSDKNLTYIATDPNTETYTNLLTLGSEIEKVTKRKDSYKIYNECAEDLKLPDESVDFCFSCPPFFFLEIYSDEKTQSYNKYPNYQEWLEHFVRPCIKNCVSALKSNGVYCVDVEDFKINGQYYPLALDWVQIAVEEGLTLQKVYPVISHSRKRDIETNIYVFTKGSVLNDYTDKATQELWEKKIEENRIQNLKRTKYIGEYDILGNLINIYPYFKEIDNFSKEDIKYSSSKNKHIKDRYFKIYNGNEEIPVRIESSVICKIDDEYFEGYADAGAYLGVSRQAIHQAHKRHSKKICKHPVIWVEDIKKI